MEVKKGYKQTEIGIFPCDWNVKQLGKIIKNYQLGGNYTNNEINTDFPLIKMGNIDRGNISLSKLEYIVKNINPNEADKLRFGDVLFNTRNTIDLVGKVAIWKGELDKAYFNSNIMRFEFNESEISSNFYMNYLLNGYNLLGQLKAIATGTTSVAAIYTRDLRKILVPVPPKNEQKNIAIAITNVIDLISALEKLIAKKEAVKKGTMQVLLTSKKRLPGFSEKWQNKKINKLFKFLSTANNSRSELSDEGEIGYIHYGDIHTKWSEFLDVAKENIPFIRKEKLKDIPFLENGDLLIADASEDYEGLCSCIELKNVNNRKIVAGLHTLLLRGNKEEIADGFKAYLPHLKGFKEAVIRAATGISVYGISKKNLGEIEITIPKIDEQLVIVSVIADMTTEVKQLEEKLQKYRMIKQSMTQQLLTGKIRLV